MYFKKTQLSYLLGLLITCSLMFFACNKDNMQTVEPEVDKTTEGTIFTRALENNTQWIEAADQGDGTYYVTGEQGTIIDIRGALVDRNGEKVTGPIKVELVEIYSASDMILNRKQTLAETETGQAILESGGEVYVQAYQNGEQLTLGDDGEFHLMMPTDNTTTSPEGMELFYGEERGEQVIWHAAGVPVTVVENGMQRSHPMYHAIVEQTLGWLNFDFFGNFQGELVECITVVIECDFCEITEDNSVVGIHFPTLNSAFELQYIGNNTFQVCLEGGMPLGGVTVDFFAIIDCGEGPVAVAIKTSTITPPNHVEVLTCDDFQFMDEHEVAETLSNL